MSSDTSVASELRFLLTAYLDGHMARRELNRRLGRFTRTISRVDDFEARRLYGAARRLLAERGAGDRTEDELRAKLRELSEFRSTGTAAA